MSFDKLPNELLLMIIEPYKHCHQQSPRTGQASVSSIEQADNTRRLAGFARVSKTWYGVIAPILYSTYVKPDNAYRRSSPPIATLAPLYAQPNKNLRLFLRSIITRPKLARDVKKLVLGSWDHTMTCFQYNNMLSSASVAIPPGDSSWRFSPQRLQGHSAQSPTYASYPTHEGGTFRDQSLWR